MEDIENLQIIAQLIESMNDALKGFEESYREQNSENFKKYKDAILEIQKKIDNLIK